MLFLYRSYNIRMNHPQPECQGCLLMKVTLMVSILPLAFRKVTLRLWEVEGTGKTAW